MTIWKSSRITGGFNLQILSVSVGNFLRAELKKIPNSPIITITIHMRKHDRSIEIVNSAAHIFSNLFLVA